jgi:serine/threonine protein kinase
MKITFANEVPLMNLDRFIQLLMGDAKKKGEGSFGKVFVMNDFLESKYDPKGIQMAGKIQKLGTNLNNRTDSYYQRMLVREIDFNKRLNQLDPHNLYFPLFKMCLNVTSRFTSILQAGQVPHERKEFFQKSYNQNIFLLFIEPMNFDFDHLVKAVRNQYYEISMNQIYQITIMLLEGVNIIKQVGNHCDIKPENIMFKMINPIFLKNVIEEGHTVVKFDSNYYLAKYIDFGLCAFHGKSYLANCDGGTPGYRPTDHLVGKDGSKYDIYSLGITLYDLVFASFGFGYLGDVMGILYNRNRNKLNTFTNDNIRILNNMSLIKNFKIYMDQYQTEFLMYCQAVYPDFEILFNQTVPDKNINNVKPSTYYLKNVIIFRQMTKAILNMFFDLIIQELPMPPSFTKNAQQIELLENNLTQMDKNSNEYSNTEININYLKDKNEIMKIDRDEMKKYGKMIYNLISPFEMRWSDEDALKYFKESYAEYDEENEEILTNLEEADDIVASEENNINSVIINITPALGMNDLRKNNIDVDETIDEIQEMRII